MLMAFNMCDRQNVDEKCLALQSAFAEYISLHWRSCLLFIDVIIKLNLFSFNANDNEKMRDSFLFRS